MAHSSASSTRSGETDLRTSSAEERTRTWDATTANSPGDPLPGPAAGDVLKDRFVVHQRLTEGPASRLFRARDRGRESAGDREAWVALKVVTATPGRESRALQALRREAALTAGLEHPNLPHVVGLDEDGPHTFLCMAWLEGDSLAAILDSRGTRPMTRVQAMHIIEGVGRALVHVHAMGITHADVKPGNILVTPEGNATLLDFGVALGPGVGDLSQAHGYTPEYASPEVLGGAAPTPADDLFSLACVAYRMLSGQRAFGEGNAREAAAAGRGPDCPPSLSPGQWRALNRALAFTRAQRQPDVATFLAQLKGSRDESPASTPVPTGGAAVRRSWPAVSLAASAMGALVIIGTVALLQREAPSRTGSTRAGASDDGELAPQARPSPPLAPPRESTREPPGLAAANSPALESVRPERRTGAAPARPAPPELPPGPSTAAGTRADLPAGEPAANGRSAEVPVTTAPELAGPPAPEPPVAAARALPDTDGPAPDGTVPFSSLAVRRYVEPAYPQTAAARQLPGWVDVAFTVDDAGRPQEVRVIAAEPAGIFDRAALSAVRRWRFAAPDAGPVSSQIRVRFEP